MEEYFHFLTLPGLGCLARGILGPRPIPRMSGAGLGWAGLGWADNSAHGDTARADDALTAAPHPSHHSCSVQFILMLIHAIDCGLEPGQRTGLLHMFQSVSGCRVSSPTPPPPLHSVLIPPVRSSSQILRYLLQCSLSRYLHPDKIIIRRCWC